MKSSARNIQMTSYDDLFSVGDVAGTTGEKVQEIALGELFPFKVLDDEAMEEMVESIRLHGVLVPGIARPRAEGGYELLAGLSFGGLFGAVFITLFEGTFGLK